MANVNTTVIIEVTGHGTITLGKHGAVADSLLKPLITTVAGGLLERRGTIGAGTAITLYDVGQGDLPATWLKFFFWCSVACQLQFIGEGTPSDVILDVAATDPVVLSGGKMLASASSSNEISNGATSTVVINKILAGSTAGGDYHMILVL